MSKKPALPKIVTPPGVGAFVWVHTPDTYMAEDGEGKYKTTLVFDAGDPAIVAFEKELRRLAQVAAKEAEVKLGPNFNMPVVPGEEYKDKDGNVRDGFAGKMVVRLASKYAPGLFNNNKQPIADGVKIMSGDLFRCSAQVYPYKGSRKIGLDGGISLRLKSVQLIEKRSFGANSADDFDDAYCDQDVESAAAREDSDF